MNTQRKHEILNELETLRKQIDFLESHMTLGLVSEEQYQETGMSIKRKVSELEDECGINKPILSSKGILYEDEAELFDTEFNQSVHKAISEVEDDI